MIPADKDKRELFIVGDKVASVLVRTEVEVLVPLSTPGVRERNRARGMGWTYVVLRLRDFSRPATPSSV